MVRIAFMVTRRLRRGHFEIKQSTGLETVEYLQQHEERDRRVLEDMPSPYGVIRTDEVDMVLIECERREALIPRRVSLALKD